MSYFKNTEYQDIEHNDYIMSLDEKSKKLLKRYFEKNQHPKINQKRRFSMIERYINLTLLGYYKQNKFNIDKIEISQIIEKNREKLTNYDLDFINLYFLDNKNDKSTKDIDLNSANYYKNKLIFNLKSNNKKRENTYYILEIICYWWAFSWQKGDLNEIFIFNKNRTIYYK